MKKVIDDERLMVKICDMYYNQDLNQKVISAQLGLSRPTVSRIISNGKERGIVKIIIDNLEGTDYVELEREIENLYGLREVIVVDTKKDIEDQKNEIGRAAAQYLERVVKDGNIVGVSMGTTRCGQRDQEHHLCPADRRYGPSSDGAAFQLHCRGSGKGFWRGVHAHARTGKGFRQTD